MVHVVAARNGDSITVWQTDGRQLEVRLCGIDCPEKGQPWGDRATEFTAEKCLNKRVLVLGRDVDHLQNAPGEPA